MHGSWPHIVLLAAKSFDPMTRSGPERRVKWSLILAALVFVLIAWLLGYVEI